MENPEQLLASTRENIDELDRAIIRLLNQRAEKAAQIGFLKYDLNLPVRSRSREETVLRNIVAANRGPLTNGQLLSIYCRVLDFMRAVQERIKPPKRR